MTDRLDGRTFGRSCDDSREFAVAADAYLPLKVLAQYSGLSVRTLRVHLVDRLRPLPHFRIGGKILVRRSDFDGWARQFRADRIDNCVDALVDDVVAGLR